MDSRLDPYSILGMSRGDSAPTRAIPENTGISRSIPEGRGWTAGMIAPKIHKDHPAISATPPARKAQTLNDPTLASRPVTGSQAPTGATPVGGFSAFAGQPAWLSSTIGGLNSGPLMELLDRILGGGFGGQQAAGPAIDPNLSAAQTEHVNLQNQAMRSAIDAQHNFATAAAARPTSYGAVPAPFGSPDTEKRLRADNDYLTSYLLAGPNSSTQLLGRSASGWYSGSPAMPSY